LAEPTKAHPVAANYPSIEGEQFDDLVEDIRSNPPAPDGPMAIEEAMPERTHWEIFDRFCGAAVQGWYRLAHTISIPDFGSRRAKKRLKEIDNAIRALEKLRTELRAKFNLPT
jgi:hypothetical protein